MRRLEPVVFAIGLLALSAVADDVRIAVDGRTPSAWRIDPLLFDSFQEEHWGDITPGVYEQYLINPSFEPWYSREEGEQKTAVAFPVAEAPGVAYPWQPAGGDAAYSLGEDCVNSQRSQRVAVRGGGEAGIVQRVALPDYRVTRYRFRFHARVTGQAHVRAVLMKGGCSELIDTAPVSFANEEWQSFEVTLDTGGSDAPRHLDHFGEYVAGLLVRGSGSLSVDQATLFPADCVEGVYNPETLALLKESRSTLTRWPGGNYTSGYHWLDGVGPIEARPTRPNPAWGGNEENHVGTDEWLRFCELAGMEPVISLGFGEISAEEAAQRVAYCNDNTDTPMGRLRAAHGRSVPYGVTYWGIGNETYGSYQIGHTDAERYARGYVEMVTAMKARDSSIKCVAVGFGVHNAYREPENRWNETVLRIAGSEIDLLDVHHYVHGPREDEEVRRDGADRVLRAFLASSQRIDDSLGEVRPLLTSGEGTRHIRLAMHEWAVLPHARTDTPRRQTFGNALCTAAQLNAILRNGDLIRQAALHNFSFYVNPVSSHSEPPNPRTYVTALYRNFAGMRTLEAQVEGPRYRVSEDYAEIGPLEGIGEVDCLARAADEGTVHLSVLNRSTERKHAVRIQIDGWKNAAAGRVEVWESDDVFKHRTWKERGLGFRKTNIDLRLEKQGFHFDLPAAALAYVRLVGDSAQEETLLSGVAKGIGNG